MAIKRYFGWTDRDTAKKGYADLDTRFSSYNTKAEGLVGDSVADDRAALNTLVNVTMQPNGGQVDVVGVPRIASALTIPSNVSLRFIDGAYLAPDVAVVVTINGGIDAKLLKKFGGGGTVLFGPSKNSQVFPQWFGAINDGIADAAPAVQAAINAAPDKSVIVVPPGVYLLSSLTPTLSGRSDLTISAYGAKFVLSGVNRMALLLTGANTRIRWLGGQIVGSNVASDNQQALGTATPPPPGTLTTDLFIYDVNIQDVSRGILIDVSVLGDATNITYRRCILSNIINPVSGSGYGLVMSGVWGGTMDDCIVNTAQRHAFYVSVCKDITLSKLRSTNHAPVGGGSYCLNIARSRDVVGSDIAINLCNNNCIVIQPHDTDVAADTGRIQLMNVTCSDTAIGFEDMMIGGPGPATSSVLYDIKVDGFTVKRLITETADPVTSIRVRHGINVAIKNVHYLAAAAITVTKPVIYLAADGGAAYSDRITIEGVKARFPNQAGGGFGCAVLVATALCGGTQRLTLRSNEVAATGGSGGQAVLYNAAVTNPEIEARFNRGRDALTGKATLVGGTVTVNNVEILTGDLVLISRLAAGGALGHLSLGAIVNATSFVINSSSGTDTSAVLWEIVH